MDAFGGIDEIAEEHRKVENLLNGVVVMPQYNSFSKLDCDQTPLCGEKLVTFDNVRRVATSKLPLVHWMMKWMMIKCHLEILSVFFMAANYRDSLTSVSICVV